MKRILHVADAGSIHTRRWAEQHGRDGLEVCVASFRPGNISGGQVRVLPTFGLGKAGYLLAVPALRALARRFRPEVVHAHYVTSYGFVAALAGLRPLVVTAWGTDVLLAPDESRVSRALASYAVRHADAVTTVAPHMNAAVARLGVAEEDVFAVPFGVDARLFRPAQSPAEAVTLRVICTRNFAPVYDVGTLVIAIGIAIGRGLRLHLDLVGDGPLRAELERQVHDADLGDVVTFHGHVDQKSLAGMLARASVFVSPSRSDGNNISLNEAMACGCFPVATDIPANVQWLENEVNGLLYPPGDAAALARCILRAAADADWRRRAAVTNRCIVEQRANWATSVARMNGIYAAAIARAGNAS